MRVVKYTAYMETPIAAREDIHLDGLFAAVAVGHSAHLTRSDKADMIVQPPLPMAKARLGSAFVWAASSWILPPEAKITSGWLTKRKDPGDLFYLAKDHERSAGPGKDYMVQHPIIATPTVSWLMVDLEDHGNPHKSRAGGYCRMIKQIGRFRRHGYGHVARWGHEVVDGLDPKAVLVQDGKAMRHLAAGLCLSGEIDQGQCRAPYWHAAMIEARVKAGRRCELRREVELV